MDIQKEKELYLAELLERGALKQDEIDDLDFKTEISAFHSSYLSARFIDNINFGWSAWQAAKAQAVPEGFVLVEKAKLMQIVGSAAIIEPITRGNPLMSKYKTELDFILSTVRAVIEAQEQK